MKMEATTVTRRWRTIVMAPATKRAVRTAESRERVLTRRKNFTSRYLHHTKRQMQCIQRFAELSTALGRDNGNSEDRKYELLKEPAIAVAKSLIQQHLARSPFQSPILSYATMLSIDNRSHAWEEPGSFNSHLSALIYCGQLWVFRCACETVDMRDGSNSEREESDDRLDKQLDS